MGGMPGMSQWLVVLVPVAGCTAIYIIFKAKCGQYPAIHISYIISQSTTL